MVSDDLKPCPFCGGEAEFVEGADDDGAWVAVACPDCGAGSRQHYPVMDDARPHAKSAWNIRALSLPQPTVDREAIADIIAAKVSGPMLVKGSTLAGRHREDQLRAADAILALLHPIDDITYAGAESEEGMTIGQLMGDEASIGMAERMARASRKTRERTEAGYDTTDQHPLGQR